ncbi:hypothetical protein G7Y89_g1377 [Cudoniella acicularis]|uniref:Uncharacterized protein n=1 Tax=Cudoniella acicularis TaxID=354080 RepID=A0A8H4W9K4_9HELO|nr:hypothetical protein G7Y89_g1377 [Cudoniella acicularis]
MVFSDMALPKYQRLDDSKEEFPRSSTCRHKWIVRLCVLLSCACVGLVVTLATVWFRHPEHIIEQQTHGSIATDKVIAMDCGNSVAEAKAKGCVFEPMEYGWTPKQCFYQELSDMYDPMGDRPWFYGPDWKEQVPTERLRQGEEPELFTPDYHAEHCLYSWRKLAWALEHRMPYIESKSADLAHSTHCGKGIIRQLFHPKGSSYTTAKLRFYSCVALNWS